MLALLVNLLNVIVDGPIVKIIFMNLLRDVLKYEQYITRTSGTFFSVIGAYLYVIRFQM